MTAARPKRSARTRAPKPEAETYECGQWSGYTNYGCPFCEFRTLEGTALVVAHIASDHREEAIAQAQEAP